MKEQLEKIHDASMTILEEVGIRLHRTDILEMLENAKIRVKDDMV